MRVVRGEHTTITHAYVLTGNGSRDIRVLSALAEKYDHSKILKTPQTPIKTGTGLTVVARALATLLNMRITVNRYLVLIDREHVESIREAERKFMEYGLEIIGTEELAEGSWMFKVKKGIKEANIYMVLLGTRKRIEENIAKLILLVYGEKVEENKEAVNNWLRKHKLEDTDLVRKATRNQLEKAFPTLTKALEKLASNT